MILKLTTLFALAAASLTCCYGQATPTLTEEKSVSAVALYDFYFQHIGGIAETAATLDRDGKPGGLQIRGKLQAQAQLLPEEVTSLLRIASECRSRLKGIERGATLVHEQERLRGSWRDASDASTATTLNQLQTERRSAVEQGIEALRLAFGERFGKFDAFVRKSVQMKTYRLQLPKPATEN